MYFIYYTEVSLLFNIIHKHIDALVPSWHEFQNSVVAEIRLLHSQPFTNNYFHFFITVGLAASEVLLQRLKQMEI
jgi:hypothetical protein